MTTLDSEAAYGSDSAGLQSKVGRFPVGVLKTRIDHDLRGDHSGLGLQWDGASPAIPADTALRRASFALKRGTDVIMAALGLLILAPLLAIVALSVKLTSPGPIFIRQWRTGLHGQEFRVFKFRSMYVDQGDQSGVQQTTTDDPRVTRVGRFLRRTSIDELPQLLNILVGDMSVVGPRPHVPGMMAGGVAYEELVPYYHARHIVKPGLTGWAQANGYRGPTDDAPRARARVNHDMAYIQNFSLLLDFRIILLTLKHEFLGGSGV